MNKKLVVTLVAVLVAGGIGYFSVLQTNPEPGNTEIETDDVSNQEFADINWKPVLESVPAYYTPPPPVKTNPGGNGGNAQPKPPKPTLISDAILTGVVSGGKPAALMRLPKTSEIVRITPGGSWLAPWVLVQVNADSVTWENSETNKKYTQYLFR